MSLLDPQERSARGAAFQTEVTAAPAPDPATPVEGSWRDFVFAEVWNRPGLERRARYLVSIAGATISGAQDSVLDGYLRGALVGQVISLAELRETALHLAVYAGWPKGQDLDRAITRVAGELGLAPAPWPPIRGDAWDPDIRTAQGMAEFTTTMTFSGGPSISPFLEAINNFVFGEMWCRPGLDQRSRRWITLVGVCESCADTPIRSHIYAAMASGNCTPEEMQEFVLQYGIHAGWPKASAIQGAVWAMSKNFAAGLPWNA
ncbi:MAG: carboxymuconolactone decarboxylase family protein [Sphingomonadales bacterium]|nr:carboxymuconolactone decarboxylase family protein [Sphingomonadales bacterium]